MDFPGEVVYYDTGTQILEALSVRMWDAIITQHGIKANHKLRQDWIICRLLYHASVIAGADGALNKLH